MIKFLPCKACGYLIEQPAKQGGRLRYCRPCKRAKIKEYARRFYLNKRANNPEWMAENRLRAKAWRAKNAEHIKLYKFTRPWP